MGFVIQSYICFLSVIVRRERTMEFGSVLDGGAVESLAKTRGHFFVIDIIAKTTCWLLMTVWLSGLQRHSKVKWERRRRVILTTNT